MIEQKLKDLGERIKISAKDDVLPFYSELQTIDNHIEQIQKDNYIQENFNLEFNEQQIFRSILENIKITGCCQMPSEDLIYPTGVLDLEQVKRYNLDGVGFLQDAAFYQLNSKLYSSGGSNNTHFTPIKDQFFSCDAYAQIQKLNPMLRKRNWHSLTGFHSHLFATGGGDLETKKSSQKYEFTKNKWCALPELIKPLCNHGSCILNSKTLFCMGRSSEEGVQYYNLIAQQAWKEVKLFKNYKFQSSLALAPLRGKIYVFSSNEKQVLVLNEQGIIEFEWRGQIKPTSINCKAVAYGRNCVFTCTKNHQLWKFDGLTWTKPDPPNQDPQNQDSHSDN